MWSSASVACSEDLSPVCGGAACPACGRRHPLVGNRHTRRRAAARRRQLRGQYKATEAADLAMAISKVLTLATVGRRCLPPEEPLEAPLEGPSAAPGPPSGGLLARAPQLEDLIGKGSFGFVLLRPDRSNVEHEEPEEPEGGEDTESEGTSHDSEVPEESEREEDTKSEGTNYGGYETMIEEVEAEMMRWFHTKDGAREGMLNIDDIREGVREIFEHDQEVTDQMMTLAVVDVTGRVDYGGFVDAVIEQLRMEAREPQGRDNFLREEADA